MRGGPMEFPRRLEQLKELGNDGMLCLTCDDTDHWSADSSSLEKLTDGIQQIESLATPRVGEINLLATFHRVRHFLRMRVGELNFAGEIVCIPELEKDDVIVAEIVLNTFRFRRYHWFRERQIFKDPRWRVDFSEDVAVVWDDAEVTVLNCLDNTLEIAHAEIIDISIESPLAG